MCSIRAVSSKECNISISVVFIIIRLDILWTYLLGARRVRYILIIINLVTCFYYYKIMRISTFFVIARQNKNAH